MGNQSYADPAKPPQTRASEPSVALKDWPVQERPRERLAQQGPGALRTAELLAILLRTGTRGITAVQVADRLLQSFGTLDSLARASLEELRRIKGVGRDKAVALQAAFALAQRLSAEFTQESPLLDTPERIADLLRESNRGHPVECFQIVLLNTRRRLIRVEIISHGTLDTLLVHPREVFRRAISVNAAAVVLAHNHPSGDPTPSEADIKVTRDLIRAGQLLKIEVLDHVILGRRSDARPQDFVSLRALGYFAGY